MNEALKPEITVITSVYTNDDPIDFKTAIASVVDQTMKPKQILLVRDGPVVAPLEEAIRELEQRHPELLKVLRLDKNVGLGEAMRIAVEAAETELLARMDSDDISQPVRLERLYQEFLGHPSLSVVGTGLAEFESDPAKITHIRVLPQEHSRLTKFAQLRSPLNHATVMMRRSEVIKAGNYQPFSSFEDYHLWIRMILNGAEFRNIPDILYLVRTGKGVINRRGGMNYLKNDIRLGFLFYRWRFLSMAGLLSYLVVRVPVRIVPPALRQWIYNTILRKKAHS